MINDRLSPSALSLYQVASHNDQIQIHLILPIQASDHPLAHYVEHLAWLNVLGGAEANAVRHSNAWTSHSAIGYKMIGTKGQLTEMLEKLTKIFDSITLPDDFALKERNVILREYDHRFTNNIDAQMHEQLSAFLYEGNALAASLLGRPDQIRAFDYDAARALHARTHRPDRTRMVVIGNLTQRDLQKALKEAGMPELVSALELIETPSFQLSSAEQTVFKHHSVTAAPRLIWRRVTALEEAIPFDLLETELALLSDILDGSLPGGLAGPLRYHAAIASSFHITLSPLDERHIELRFLAEPDQDVTLFQLQQAFEAAFNQISKNSIPKSTYKRVLARFDDYWPDWRDEAKTGKWMARYGLDRISAMRSPLSEKAIKKLRHQLSHQRLNFYLKHLTKSENRTAIAYIGPEDLFQ